MCDSILLFRQPLPGICACDVGFSSCCLGFFGVAFIIWFFAQSCVQAESARLQAQLDALRSSSSSNAAAAGALAALQARHEQAEAQLASLFGADERATQLTVENDRLRERLERTEGQVTGYNDWVRDRV